MWATMQALRVWPARRWAIAPAAAAIIALLIAVPTAVIPNPVFGRAVAVTWWSYPVVAVTAILGGLLVASYVRPAGESVPAEELDRASKFGLTGSLISFFAVGCPVCNKLVLLALGASGAISWFAPIQPILAMASIALMAVALLVRLRNENRCALPAPRPTTPSEA